MTHMQFMIYIYQQAVILVYYATESAEASKQKRFLFWGENPPRPPIEKEHSWFAHAPRPTEYVNDTDYSVALEFTPDWRFEEYPLKPYWIEYQYREYNRPYRISPAYKQAHIWSTSGSWFWPNKDKPELLGCYCNTVYRRLTLLGTCAVITTRHILTTASSTEVILRKYDKNYHLDNILGIWYDHDANTYNSSMYATPARIHYHPKFIMPENVNVSHPLPIYQDLAVWATTFPHVGGTFTSPRAFICQRAGSFWLERASPVPGYYNDHEAFLVGFQFMMWYKKKPMPWFKYAIKTNRFLREGCPKAEWGWFFCIRTRIFLKGMDSGMMMHRNTLGISWLYDGLWAVGSFSMSLRADQPIHYFTPVENYDALEFMYNAYMGRLPYRYLDKRFWNTRDSAPIVRPGEYVAIQYDRGVETIFEEPPIRD